MLKVCVVAFATLLFAGCEEKETTTPTDASHSAMWERLKNMCPVRTDDVLNIDKPCAVVSRDGQVIHHVYAITTGDYYLVADTIANDRRLMREELFRQTLGIGPDDIPRITSIS